MQVRVTEKLIHKIYKKLPKTWHVHKQQEPIIQLILWMTRRYYDSKLINIVFNINNIKNQY